MKKEIVTYEMFGNLCNILVEKIKKDPRKIECVYGLKRGGLPLAVHMSHHLNIPLLDHISWGIDDIKDHILIVDDVADTGKTLKNIKWLVKNKKYLIATLFYKPISTIFPDYFCVQTTDWIQFPWECEQSKTSKYHQEIYPNLVKKEIHHYDAGNDDLGMCEFLDDMCNGRSIE